MFLPDKSWQPILSSRMIISAQPNFFRHRQSYVRKNLFYRCSIKVLSQSLRVLSPKPKEERQQPLAGEDLIIRPPFLAFVWVPVRFRFGQTSMVFLQPTLALSKMGD